MLTHLGLRCLLVSEMSLHIYTTYEKGVLSLKGWNRVVQAKEDTKHLTNINYLTNSRFYCTSLYEINRQFPFLHVTKIQQAQLVIKINHHSKRSNLKW